MSEDWGGVLFLVWWSMLPMSLYVRHRFRSRLRDSHPEAYEELSRPSGDWPDLRFIMRRSYTQLEDPTLTRLGDALLAGFLFMAGPFVALLVVLSVASAALLVMGEAAGLVGLIFFPLFLAFTAFMIHRSWRGPSTAALLDPELHRSEVWQQFADAVGGRLVSQETGPWFRRRSMHKVVAPVGRWSLTLDTYTDLVRGYKLFLSADAVGKEEWRAFVVHTLMTARYDDVASLEFEVSLVGRLSGAGGIDAGFDSDFSLNGNDAEQVQRLFASAQLREAVQSAIGPPYSSWLSLTPGRGHFGGESGQLFFREAGPITNLERLMDLHKLFEETLNQLERIGEVSAQAGADRQR